jgi:hypothetical protein
LIDVNDENFIAIPDENRATAAGWEHSANMYLNDRFVHRVDGTDGRTKNKLLPAVPRLAPRPRGTRAGFAYVFSTQSENDCFWGSAGSLPAVFGSLAKHNIVGKLPSIASWQPALLGSARHAERARDLLLFFESTLHVPPDQQLSVLQPLTK